MNYTPRLYILGIPIIAITFIIFIFICALAVLACCTCITYIEYCFTRNISNPNSSDMENRLCENPTPRIMYRANKYGNMDLESHNIQQIMPEKIKELPPLYSECTV